MASAASNKSRSSKNGRFDSLAQEAYLNLWRTYDRLKAFEDDLFNQHDLSAQQYNTLRLLRSAHPGTLQTLEIGAQLISRAPDMTRLLDKLEERGLVLRERRRENRRVVEVGITEQGIALLNELSDAVGECHDKQLGHLNDKQLRELVALLTQVREPHEEADGLWATKSSQHKSG